MEGRFNPMVNVGAVTTTSMVKGDTLEKRIDLIREMFSGYMGYPSGFDEGALNSRKKLDNINRAIAYLMLSEGCIEGDVEETVELLYSEAGRYFKTDQKFLIIFSIIKIPVGFACYFSL
jgi:glutaminase